MSHQNGQSREQQQTLATVMRYLQQHNLNETFETLQKEVGGLGTMMESSSSSGITASPMPKINSNPTEWRQSYARFSDFVEDSLDVYRSELSQLLFPVFVHMYLGLVENRHTSEAREFFASYHGNQESFFSRELSLLRAITVPEHFHGNQLVECFKKNKFCVRMSNDTYQVVLKFLQQQSLLLRLIKQYFSISVFDGGPRTELDVQSRTGPLLGEPETAVNKTKVLYGFPRDPDLVAALAEMEEEEQGAGLDDDKPKKKKLKKDTGSGKRSKSGAIPHAPLLTRLPLPKPRDCEILARFTAQKESAKCSPLSPEALPSICFYTVLNTGESLNAITISEDSTMLVGAFADSTLRVWTLTPQQLLSMATGRQLSQIPLSAEDITTRMMDPLTGSEVKVLHGHSGPVFSAAINYDNSLLLSASEDGTIRLWSLQLFTTLVVFKAHIYPVWSVDFSPLGFYFASGSHDRTACIWSTEQAHPVRVLAGHTADVDVIKYHPNGNYLATGSSDRTVRLWDIVTGECVRVFSGHKGAITALAFSPDGKYLAAAGEDSKILLWCLPTAKQVGEFRGHTDTPYSLVFSQDSNLLASSGLDQCVKLWDCTQLDEEGLSTGKGQGCVGSFATKSTPVTALHFTRRNLLLAAGSITK